jgi:hypothetical protein
MGASPLVADMSSPPGSWTTCDPDERSRPPDLLVVRPYDFLVEESFPLGDRAAGPTKHASDSYRPYWQKRRRWPVTKPWPKTPDKISYRSSTGATRSGVVVCVLF